MKTNENKKFLTKKTRLNNDKLSTIYKYTYCHIVFPYLSLIKGQKDTISEWLGEFKSFVVLHSCSSYTHGM